MTIPTPGARHRFLSEEVAERLLALPTPPPSPLSPYSSPLPQIPSPPLPISSQPPNSPTYVEGSLGSRAAGIRQRDALPSSVHEIEMPKIYLPLRKRPCCTTPGPRYEVGESSAAGTARQVGPATARANLYGFADMLDADPRRQTSKELGYGITDTWDDLVGAIQEIAPTTLERVNQRVTELVTTDRPFHRRTALLMEEEARLCRAAWARLMDACDQATDRRRQSVISDLLKADYRRQRQLAEHSRDPKDSEEPQGSDDRDAETAGTCYGSCRARATRGGPQFVYVILLGNWPHEEGPKNQEVKGLIVTTTPSTSHRNPNCSDPNTPLRSPVPKSLAMIDEGCQSVIGSTGLRPGMAIDSPYLGKTRVRRNETHCAGCAPIKTS
ncbi:hypothetical protein Tco_0516319 [Tanacetum coccineum]